MPNKINQQCSRDVIGHSHSISPILILSLTPILQPQPDPPTPAQSISMPICNCHCRSPAWGCAVQTSCVAWKPVAPQALLPSWSGSTRLVRISGSQSAQSFVLVNGFVRVIILPRSRVSQSGNPNLVQFLAHSCCTFSPQSLPGSCSSDATQLNSTRCLWPQRYRASQLLRLVKGSNCDLFWRVRVLILRLFDILFFFFVYLIGCFYWLLMIREMIEASLCRPQAILLLASLLLLLSRLPRPQRAAQRCAAAASDCCPKTSRGSCGCCCIHCDVSSINVSARNY